MPNPDAPRVQRGVQRGGARRFSFGKASLECSDLSELSPRQPNPDAPRVQRGGARRFSFGKAVEEDGIFLRISRREMKAVTSHRTPKRPSLFGV